MITPLSEFADKLSSIIPVIMREFARRHISELYKDKITLPQFFILSLVHEKGESRMTDLAHFTKVSTAAITGIVDRLVKYGYVLRVFDPNDRRIIKIKITPKGAGVIRKIIQERRKMIIETFGQIPESERQDYLRILLRIHNILTKEKEG